MPCGKETYFEIENPRDTKDFCEMVLKKEFFSFAQVDIEVPEELRPKFSEFTPLFLVREVNENQIPDHMKKYRQDTGRSAASGSNKGKENSFVHATDQMVPRKRSQGNCRVQGPVL